MLRRLVEYRQARKTLTVRHGPRVSGGLRGSVFTPCSSTSTYAFRTMDRVLHACLGMRLYKALRGTWFFQLQGVPIGGPLTKMMISLAVGHQEHIWSVNRGPSFFHSKNFIYQLIR